MTKATPSDGETRISTEQMSLEGDAALRLYYLALARNLKAIDDQFADLSDALMEWLKISGANDHAGEAS